MDSNVIGSPFVASRDPPGSLYDSISVVGLRKIPGRVQRVATRSGSAKHINEKEF